MLGREPFASTKWQMSSDKADRTPEGISARLFLIVFQRTGCANIAGERGGSGSAEMGALVCRAENCDICSFLYGIRRRAL